MIVYVPRLAWPFHLRNAVGQQQVRPLPPTSDAVSPVPHWVNGFAVVKTRSLGRGYLTSCLSKAVCDDELERLCGYTRVRSLNCDPFRGLRDANRVIPHVRCNHINLNACVEFTSHLHFSTNYHCEQQLTRDFYRNPPL